MPRLRKTPDMLELEETDPYGRAIEDLMRDAWLHYGSKYQASLALGISYNTYLKWEYVLKVQYPARRRSVSQPIPRPPAAPPLPVAPVFTPAPPAEQPWHENKVDNELNTFLWQEHGIINPGFTPPPPAPDTLKFAVDEAYAQQVADMLHNGRITEDEADERLANPIPFPFPAAPAEDPDAPLPSKSEPEPEVDDIDARLEQEWLRRMAAD